MTYQHKAFPAVYYGSKGETKHVNSAEEIPHGFKAHPSHHKADPKTEIAGEAQTQPAAEANGNNGGAGNAGESTNGQTQPAALAKAGANVDVDGHTWDEKLHAATKSKTKDGRWRMKVGVARPAPAPGFPITPALTAGQPLDL